MYFLNWYWWYKERLPRGQTNFMPEKSIHRRNHFASKPKLPQAIRPSNVKPHDENEKTNITWMMMMVYNKLTPILQQWLAYFLCCPLQSPPHHPQVPCQSRYRPGVRVLAGSLSWTVWGSLCEAGAEGAAHPLKKVPHCCFLHKDPVTQRDIYIVVSDTSFPPGATP